MINPIEKSLRKQVSKERNLEMKKYGRIKSYNKISNLLRGDKKTVFSIINHTIAIIDDETDLRGDKKQLDLAIRLLTDSYQNYKMKILLKKKWEMDIFHLGKLLSKLQNENFIYAPNIFKEIVNYWETRKQNLSRKNKILNSHNLDNLNLKVGKSVSLQFLYLLCPNLKNNVRERIAGWYGLAIKLADNLSDLNEDLREGYINISKESIKKYNLSLEKLPEKNLQQYIKAEYKRIKRCYKKGDNIVQAALKKYPSQQKGILIFKEIAHSWFKQVLDVYKIY